VIFVIVCNGLYFKRRVKHKKRKHSNPLALSNTNTAFLTNCHNHCSTLIVVNPYHYKRY